MSSTTDGSHLSSRILQIITGSSTAGPDVTGSEGTLRVSSNTDDTLSPTSILPTVLESVVETMRTLAGVSTDIVDTFRMNSDLSTKGHAVEVTHKSDGIFTSTSPEASGGLTPMWKWFIATGVIIGLVIILIIVNCCINFKERLAKTMKDVKRYTESEKRVHREKFQASDHEEERPIKTHVFMHWVDKKGHQDQNHI